MQTQTREQAIFSCGEWVHLQETFDVINPQNGITIATVPKATGAFLTEVIERTESMFRQKKSWATHERIRVLARAADYIEDRAETYAHTIALEGSKTIREARAEVTRAVTTLRISSEEARRMHGETIPFDQRPGSERRHGYYMRLPMGIVAAITPFNDPLNLVAHKVGPALAVGNPVIVKPASATPLSALLLAEALEASGLPKGYLSVVTGSGQELGPVLAKHPSIKMISFTGGAEAGDQLAKLAGKKKLSMELGSNSPVIVLKDADVDDATSSCVDGGFSAAGQNCIGVQRIYVERERYEEFVRLAAEKTQTLRVGDKLLDTTDIGPMISAREAERVEAWVEEAVAGGAKVLAGGKREGAFFEPTVLVDVPPSATIYHEEVFGPVVLIEQIDSLEEGVAKANDVNYGLHAGIFTASIDQAFYAIEHLEVGGVMVNDSSDYRVDAMPFGGVKESGVGREGIKFAMEEMTETKVVCFRMK
ncbi:aldehyde dehydrogenase family protein [Paenalkalicoccus suaedae]|uniref:Aldehyde dehydrogenase family protein n=2 Tax=Paenalkalicoccus suaedae TaxID=2592382 RepID=A0A859FKG8_9BACI|nr:aldehyde dehydrogenase family protein [Paenalkalicoccus suaedae]QKS73297.1 aldehyde dehydrogenase family protein [Paenalkalicoccus suaedae]